MAFEIGIDTAGAARIEFGIGEEIEHPRSDQHVLPQRNGDVARGR